MRVGVIGINYKLADLKLREQLARVCQRRFGAGNATHGHHSFILLSTCNRTEIYFSSEELALSHSYILNILTREVSEIEDSFDQKLYTYFGDDCFKHLARVSAGLDSAVVGETEIQGQVKSAYETAVQYLNVPSELHYMFQKSLKISKDVRTKLPMGRGVPDVEHAILNSGVQVFGKVQNVNVLVVGASEINRKVIMFLKNKNFANITLCNRSLEPAQLFAEKFGLNSLQWNNLDNWHTFDWIILGTKASEHLITEIPKDCVGRKLVIDLSVPRNAAPSIGRNPQITLLNIDQINLMLHNRKQKMNKIITEAEDFVEHAIARHHALFESRSNWEQQKDCPIAVNETVIC